MDKVTVTIPARQTVNAEIDGVKRAGGTTDYNRLNNLPTLNGVEIKGDHDSGYYGLPMMWFGTLSEYNALPVIDPSICYFIEEGS